jgi:hypothetical protein
VSRSSGSIGSLSQASLLVVDLLRVGAELREDATTRGKGAGSTRSAALHCKTLAGALIASLQGAGSRLRIVVSIANLLGTLSGQSLSGDSASLLVRVSRSSGSIGSLSQASLLVVDLLRVGAELREDATTRGKGAGSTRSAALHCKTLAGALIASLQGAGSRLRLRSRLVLTNLLGTLSGQSLPADSASLLVRVSRSSGSISSLSQARVLVVDGFGVGAELREDATTRGEGTGGSGSAVVNGELLARVLITVLQGAGSGRGLPVRCERFHRQEANEKCNDGLGSHDGQ